MYKVSQNQVIKHLVNKLRDETTDAFAFRNILSQIAKLLSYEALNDMQTIQQTINTWNGSLNTQFIDERNIVFIPILRAAQPMLDGVLEIFTNSVGGFLAMKRDELTAKSQIYYKRYPNLKDKIVILLDPMVATGGSLIDGITLIKEELPKAIYSLNILGSVQGVEEVNHHHPDLKMFIAQIDEELDTNKYILPGLGDAGDRAFNTL